MIRDVLVLDGGFATQLELPPWNKDLSSELWSAECLLTDPDSIKEVHKEYVEAGADVISTSSYQLNLEGLLKRGLSKDQAKQVCRDSIRLAREAVSENKDVLIALSLGPYGATLANGSEYTGEYPPVDLVNFHKSRLHLFEEKLHSVDIVLFETIPSLDEAIAIQSAVQEFNLKQIWISFSCKLHGDTMLLSSGQSLSSSIKQLMEGKTFAAYGVNCSKSAPSDKFKDLLASLAMTIRGTQLRALLYPDGGATWDAVRREWSSVPMSPDIFAKQAMTWLDEFKGIPIAIGGCCGTSSAHIRALSAAIQARS